MFGAKESERKKESKERKESKRKFDVKLRKVGNSYVVTIPADFVERFELDEGDFLNLEINPNEIKKINKKGGDK